MLDPQEATGRSWEEWRAYLDSVGARDLDHAAIAKRIVQDHPEVSGWWAQGLTVSYERIIGRRLPGQRTDGTFTVSASRVVAGERPEVRDRAGRMLLSEGGIGGKVFAGGPRTTDTPVRSYWRHAFDDGSRVSVGVEDAGPGKVKVAVEHERLLTPEDRELLRGAWKDFLARL
ncbi:hypothetical protein GCM10027079_24060 [Sediminivirga luteola]|uniref:SRPBCC domain-containing protein n=2 Tax=Sediminivirga luteola TaxID=1774748 RepID=A0A8J2U197_9MICO|nr:hypothetical protein GCM10011333_33530 [Sediminivirga luteola]